MEGSGGAPGRYLCPLAAALAGGHAECARLLLKQWGMQHGLRHGMMGWSKSGQALTLRDCTGYRFRGVLRRSHRWEGLSYALGSLYRRMDGGA